MVIRSAVGDCVEYHAPRWEEETGAHVNITKVPIDTLHQEIFGDLKGAGKYDAYQTAAWFYGDFFTSDEPYIVEIAPFLKDPKYPYWDPDQFLPAMKRLYTWQGKLYGVLFDADAQILYYRKDVLGNADYQEKFKGKLGYDLPNPPKTMKEMHDVASFFTGWDWNGDGKDDWGISLHAKPNEQGFFHFLTLAAPYVVSPNNKYFYFNPDDMKPLINSEGHLRALEEYVKFLPNGPQRTNWLDTGTGLERVFKRARRHGTDLGRSTHLSAGPRPLQRTRSRRRNHYSRDDGGIQPADEPMGKDLAQYGREYERRELALCDFTAIQTERSGVRFPRVHG